MRTKPQSEIVSAVNQLEIELQNFDFDLKEWSLNYFQSHRNRYIHELSNLVSLYSNSHILEIGSSPLHMTILMKKSGMNVTGIDIAPERLSELLDKYDLEVLKCDIEKQHLPFGDGIFDLVILTEVFEHLRIDPIFTIGEICRTLKPGGKLLLSTPNLYSYFNRVNYLKGRAFDDPYNEFGKLHSIGHMGHVRLYAAHQLKNFLLKTGFTEVEISFQVFSKIKGKLAFVNTLYKLFPHLMPFIYALATK